LHLNLIPWINAIYRSDVARGNALYIPYQIAAGRTVNAAVGGAPLHQERDRLSVSRNGDIGAELIVPIESDSTHERVLYRLRSLADRLTKSGGAGHAFGISKKLILIHKKQIRKEESRNRFLPMSRLLIRSAPVYALKWTGQPFLDIFEP
jgi:hypothetical protein